MQFCAWRALGLEQSHPSDAESYGNAFLECDVAFGRYLAVAIDEKMNQTHLSCSLTNLIPREIK